jgi:hypothetical protein
MPIEISEDVLQNDEFSIITDSNGDLVLEHKSTGGQFKFDSVNNAWKPVQGLAMGGSDIDSAGNVDVGQSLVVQDLTVNGSVSGINNAIFLEASDTLKVDSLHFETTDQSLITLFNGSAATVLGGSVRGYIRLDWKYTFANGSTQNLHGGDGYDFVKAEAEDAGDDQYRVNMLPPAKDVTRVEVAANTNGGNQAFGANLLRLE